MLHKAAWHNSHVYILHVLLLLIQDDTTKLSVTTVLLIVAGYMAIVVIIAIAQCKSELLCNISCTVNLKFICSLSIAFFHCSLHVHWPWPSIPTAWFLSSPVKMKFRGAQSHSKQVEQQAAGIAIDAIPTHIMARGEGRCTISLY